MTLPNKSQSIDGIETLDALFSWRAQASPNAEAYRQFDPLAQQWVSHSWRQMVEQVDLWRAAIAKLGLARGARVAILLPNSVAAICADQAALALGLVTVPMHALDNPASIGYILSDCQTSLLIATTLKQWQAIIASSGALPDLKQVVIVEDMAADEAQDRSAWPALEHVGTWLGQGAAPALPVEPPVQPEQLASIVYTSGTTGRPKGVMLSHRNVVSNVRAVMSRVHPQPSDVFLSFLPLSHTFERTAGYYLPMAAGSCVAFSRSVALLGEDFKIVRPTILISVPRIYERIHAKIQEGLVQAGGIKRMLFEKTQAVGWNRFCRRQKLPLEAGAGGIVDALAWPLLDQLVASKVRAVFGGRLRCAVTGGAAMPMGVARTFLAMGIPLLQGYGMTETSPVVAANALDNNWPATVGCALPGVDVRIGEGSELQVRGACVMQGYWGRPEDTALAMTADGWLRTGDQAVIEQGHIRISGRIKEIIVTSTGEKIAPADVELAIMSDPMFEQAMIVGENRPYIAAFVVLNRTLWPALAKELGVDASAMVEADATAVRAALLARIKDGCNHLPYYAVPRTVSWSMAPWTVEQGLITPTLKLKRKALQGRLSTEIEATYARKGK